MTPPPYFDHEKLDVYRNSIAFCAWVADFLPHLTQKTPAKDQLDRASMSIPLNIAEGNGKFSGKDRARFFEMARASALESAACLDVLVARKLATAEQIAGAKSQLAAIVRMMIGLLKRFSERADVLNEESGSYGYDQDQENDQDHEHE